MGLTLHEHQGHCCCARPIFCPSLFHLDRRRRLRHGERASNIYRVALHHARLCPSANFPAAARSGAGRCCSIMREQRIRLDSCTARATKRRAVWSPQLVSRSGSLGCSLWAMLNERKIVRHASLCSSAQVWNLFLVILTIHTIFDEIRLVREMN